MRYLRTVVVLMAAMTAACGSSDDDQKSTGTASERLGRDASQQISATLQRAENARVLQEQHANQIEQEVRISDGGGN